MKKIEIQFGRESYIFDFNDDSIEALSTIGNIILRIAGNNA